MRLTRLYISPLRPDRMPEPRRLASTITLQSLIIQQSIPATRLAYEKLAAGIKEREEGKGFRRDVTAAEDKFNPDWMRNEERENAEQRRNRN